MAKKKKKNTLPMQGAMPGIFAGFRRFDWLVLMLAVIILLVAALAAGHPYKLDSADPYGFLVWFLLLLGHLPMEIIEFAARFSGVEGTTIENIIRDREAILLGACDLTVLAIVWGVMRFAVLKRYGAEPLRIAAIFLQLLIFWGLFQLFCFIAVKNWSDGKVNPLHRDLKKTKLQTVQKQ